MSEGATHFGVISSIRPDFLIVNLPGNYRGNVALADISDTYEASPTSKFSKDQIVRCAVLKAEEPTKCALSLRKSRYSRRLLNLMLMQLALSTNGTL